MWENVLFIENSAPMNGGIEWCTRTRRSEAKVNLKENCRM